jgi:SAM-dependent methyltransferase
LTREVAKWDNQASHNHSLLALNYLDQFDDFKSSIKHMADFGCGKGLDLEFWANMHTWTEEGEPGPKLNFNCVGFDLNAENNVPNRHNIKYKNYDFNTDDVLWSVPFDVVWCHNLMQYMYSPVEFLGRVNRNMATGGMLYLCVPSTVSVFQNRFQNYTPAQHFNTFTVSQIIYLLALNGFDVNDFYLQKEQFVDIIQVVTYKERKPLSYTTSWYEMADMGILNDNIKEIVLQNNTLSDQGLVTKWLDGTIYDYRWHT